jgi:hypothetical protein
VFYEISLASIRTSKNIFSQPRTSFWEESEQWLVPKRKAKQFAMDLQYL